MADESPPVEGGNDYARATNGVVNSINAANNPDEIFDASIEWTQTAVMPFVDAALHPDSGDPVLDVNDVMTYASSQFSANPSSNLDRESAEDLFRKKCYDVHVEFVRQIRAGNVFVDEYHLDDLNTILSTTQVTEDMVIPVVEPSVDADGTLNQGQHPSSSIACILSNAAYKSHLCNAQSTILSGLDAYHANSAPFTVRNVGGVYIATARNIMTTAITAVFEPLKSLLWGNFTRWWSNVGLCAARWVNGGRDMWGANPGLPQNFMQVPSIPLRLSKCYIASHWKLERLSRWYVYARRIGMVRWINRFHNIYVYRYGDSVAGYVGWFGMLYMSYALMPGMFLHPVYVILGPHYYDKTRSYPTMALAAAAATFQSLRWAIHHTQNPMNVVLKYGQLLMQIIRDKNLFRANGPPSAAGYHEYEEGEFVYLSSDPLQCIMNHLSKSDRHTYYSTNPGVCREWEGDSTFMVLLNRDVTAKPWFAFDELTNGCAQVIKTKYPQPPFATFHVIYGDTDETLLSDMEFILYWNFYRPLVRPLLYRVVVKEEKDGEGEDDNKQHKKKRKVMPKGDLN